MGAIAKVQGEAPAAFDAAAIGSTPEAPATHAAIDHRLSRQILTLENRDRYPVAAPNAGVVKLVDAADSFRIIYPK